MPPSAPINLTALAERLRLPSDKQHRVVRVLTRADIAFEVIAGPDDTAKRQQGEPGGPGDEIYVVISGEGAFRCDATGEIVEFTTGDVLFVPAGARCRFERLSRGFVTWRILLGASIPDALDDPR